MVSQIELKNCTEVLTEETISESNSDTIRFDTDDNILCLDPKDAQMNSIKGGIGG